MAEKSAGSPRNFAEATGILELTAQVPEQERARLPGPGRGPGAGPALHIDGRLRRSGGHCGLYERKA